MKTSVHRQTIWSRTDWMLCYKYGTYISVTSNACALPNVGTRCITPIRQLKMTQRVRLQHIAMSYTSTVIDLLRTKVVVNRSFYSWKICTFFKLLERYGSESRILTSAQSTMLEIAEWFPVPLYSSLHFGSIRDRTCHHCDGTCRHSDCMHAPVITLWWISTQIRIC